MEVEDHHYVLACFDVSKPFRVFLVDNQRSLYVRNAPVAGEHFGVRTDEADDPQLDAHPHTPPICSRPCSLPPQGGAYAKTPGIQLEAVERFLTLYHCPNQRVPAGAPFKERRFPYKAQRSP